MRFERRSTLAEVAALVGGRVEGDSSIEVGRIAPVADAVAGEIGLLADRRYLEAARTSRATALLVSADLSDGVRGETPRVVVDDARRALQALLAAWHPPRPPAPGVHPTAVIGQGVVLGEGVEVGAYVVLGAGASVGDGSRIEAHAVIGEGCRVGAGVMVHPHVVLYPGTIVGDRVILHAGARLGVDGFGYVWTDGGHRKVPQVGGCIIEDDVEIGANSTIDRGSIGDTVVGAGTKLDNLVHLAHNVRTGPHCAAAALVGIAGSTRLGAGVFFGGQSGATGHLEVGDGVRVTAKTAVLRSVPAGETVAGIPARPNREYLRSRAHVERLPRLLDRLARLEERLARLEEGDDPGEGRDGAPVRGR